MILKFQNHILNLFFQDSNFNTALELAVRFGKTLIIQEMDGIEPVLYPLLRADLVSQGKSWDYRHTLKLHIRCPFMELPPRSWQSGKVSWNLTDIF